MNARSTSETLRGYAQLARVSNLPTCWSNVLVGGAVAAYDQPLPWGHVVAAGAAVSLFYVAAMAMNDLVDAHNDRQEHPNRPIPLGTVSPRGATLFTVLANLLGLTMLAVIGPWAIGAGTALVLTALSYNLLHRKSALSVLIMGACRGWAYLVAAAVVFPTSRLTGETGPHGMFFVVALITVMRMAVALGIYTAVFTYIARREDEPQIGRRRWLGLVLLITVWWPAGLTDPSHWWWAAAAGLVMTAWLATAARLVLIRPPQTRRAVMMWLSGICLVDASFLTLLDRPGLVGAAVGCFIITTWAHRRVSGT